MRDQVSSRLEHRLKDIQLMLVRAEHSNMAKDKNNSNNSAAVAPIPKNGSSRVVELTVVDGRIEPDTNPGVKQ
jgi:hypothetical protein